MTTETLTFLTDSGMMTIAMPVPEEFDAGDLRRAWFEGTSAGATAMWDALNPEDPPHPPREFGEEPRTAALDAAVETAADAILWRTRGADQPGVDWPRELDAAKSIARVVLESLGWRDVKPPSDF